MSMNNSQLHYINKLITSAAIGYHLLEINKYYECKKSLSKYCTVHL